MSINWCTDKPNVVYPYDGILFDHKKEGNANICYSLDRPWKPAKWKKPDTKGHMVYDSTYQISRTGRLCRYRKLISGCQGQEGAGR